MQWKAIDRNFISLTSRAMLQLLIDILVTKWFSQIIFDILNFHAVPCFLSQQIIAANMILKIKCNRGRFVYLKPKIFRPITNHFLYHQAMIGMRVRKYFANACTKEKAQNLFFEYFLPASQVRVWACLDTTWKASAYINQISTYHL